MAKNRKRTFAHSPRYAHSLLKTGDALAVGNLVGRFYLFKNRKTVASHRHRVFCMLLNVIILVENSRALFTHLIIFSANGIISGSSIPIGLLQRKISFYVFRAADCALNNKIIFKVHSTWRTVGYLFSFQFVNQKAYAWSCWYTRIANASTQTAWIAVIMTKIKSNCIRWKINEEPATWKDSRVRHRLHRWSTHVFMHNEDCKRLSCCHCHCKFSLTDSRAYFELAGIWSDSKLVCYQKRKKNIHCEFSSDSLHPFHAETIAIWMSAWICINSQHASSLRQLNNSESKENEISNGKFKEMPYKNTKRSESSEMRNRNRWDVK